MQQFLPVYYLTFIYSSTCFGRPHAHHHELHNCSSSLWFYRWSVVVAVLSGRPARPRPTALHYRFLLSAVFCLYPPTKQLIIIIMTNITALQIPSISCFLFISTNKTVNNNNNDQHHCITDSFYQLFSAYIHQQNS